MNLPNKLSLLRLILIPVAVLMVYLDFEHCLIVSTAIFLIAAFTDFLDGYIARKYDLVTDLGKFLDSSADKVLVLSMLVVFVDKAVIMPPFGAIATVLVIAREIMISCLRMIAAKKGVVMAADKLGKIKTALQDVALVVMPVAFDIFGGFDNVLYMIGFVVFAASVIMAVVSGVNYFIVNKHVLKDSQK